MESQLLLGLKMLWRSVVLGRTEAWCEGNQAYYDGCGYESNPYSLGDYRYLEWVKGYKGQKS